MHIKECKSRAYAFGVVLTLMLTSCQKSSDNIQNPSLNKEEQHSESETPPPVLTPPIISDPNSTTEFPVEKLFICSKLDFSGLSFPPVLNEEYQNAFALALNVTGSFEGSLAWTTIANNSDGMGMSLGLLQQNFGSGTLQPLLIELRNRFPMTFASAFGALHFSSLNGMLRQWEGSVGPSRVDVTPLVKAKYLFVPDQYGISDLDEDLEDANGELRQRALAKNQLSVDWAVKNVYSGNQFKSDWKREFMSLADSKDYRALQLNDAIQYHHRTLDYLNGFDFKQMRFYLLMYDFVIQNGGFKESHWNQYVTYRRQNPNATEEQRAIKLIEIRVASVRSQYRADVRARKMTIVNGAGTVHGERRQLAKEYCYEPQYSVR